MMDGRIAASGGTRIWPAVLVVLAWYLVGAIATAEPQFTPLLAAHETTALLELEGTVFAGLDGGGLVVAPTSSPADYRTWYAGEELGGNEVTDLAWTGRHLWVATADGGLTRVNDPGGDPEFRPYTSNLGSLDVTAVAGAVIGESERVYYGMSEGGLGQIVDGLSGNIYTAEQDGLVGNDVTALALLGNDLFIATTDGVSRFSSNLFVTVNEGLPEAEVSDLVVTEDGVLVAGTPAGVFAWDPDTSTWSAQGSIGSAVTDLASGSLGLFALRGGTSPRLSRWDAGAWLTVTLPKPLCGAVAAGQNLWVGGRVNMAGMTNAGGLAYLARGGAQGGFATTTLTSSLVRNAEGVTFDPSGDPWIGSYVADAVSSLGDDGWTSIYELDSNTEEDRGLFNYSSNILAMASDLQGKIWISQYTTGLIRHDPVTGLDAYFTKHGSGMSGAYILDMVVHPDGPLIITHDIAWQEGAVYPEKIDILLDPDHADDPLQWLTLPVDEGGITSTNRIWSAVVQRRDVVWFAAEDYGLLRWDINGDAAGPDDPLTWGDFTDDSWDGPFASLSGTGNDPRSVKGLALAPDGTIWAGGNGLTRISFNEISGSASAVESYGEKVSTVVPGLVSGSVADVVVDGNGDVWASCTAGLNRIRTRGGQTTVDAWIDQGNYLANNNFGLLYSIGVIAPLPGTTYRDMAVSPDGKQVLVTSDRGAVLIDVGQDQAGGSASLGGVYCYPNPWVPDLGSGELHIGGLPDGATDGFTAEIYNVEGEMVYRAEGVLPESGFWGGLNRYGDAVATGMYLVRVTWEGQSFTVPLGVVR